MVRYIVYRLFLSFESFKRDVKQARDVWKWSFCIQVLLYLIPEETIALLFDIVVNNSGHLLLPDFKPVYIDIILNVLKRPPESIRLCTK